MPLRLASLAQCGHLDALSAGNISTGFPRLRSGQAVQVSVLSLQPARAALEERRKLSESYSEEAYLLSAVPEQKITINGDFLLTFTL